MRRALAVLVLALSCAAPWLLAQGNARTVGEGLYARGCLRTVWYRQPAAGEAVQPGHLPLASGRFNPAGRTADERYGAGAGAAKGNTVGEAMVGDVVLDVLRAESNPVGLVSNRTYALTAQDLDDLKIVYCGTAPAYRWVQDLYRSIYGREPGRGDQPASPPPVPAPVPKPTPAPQPPPAPPPAACPAPIVCPACSGPVPVPAPVLEALRRLEAAAQPSRSKPVQIGPALRGYIRRLAEWVKNPPAEPSTGRLEIGVVPGSPGDSAPVTYTPAPASVP